MSKYYLIETVGPFTVLKGRAPKREGAILAIIDGIERASERQRLNGLPATIKAATWNPDNGPFQVEVGNYTIKAERIST